MRILLTGAVLILFFMTVPGPLLSSETIPYYLKHEEANVKYITVYLNGIPVEMIFDTGSSQILVNHEVYKKLGAPRTNGTKRANTAGGNIKIRIFEIPSVQWGNIIMRNVSAAFYPDTELNLFGGHILKEFNYLIDEKQKTITFFHKSESVIFKETGEHVEYHGMSGKEAPSSLEFRVKERE
ncbi:MAG: retropepsin-like domain-containing protein [Alphaproteobacteria bacterium]|uniref:Retropepsin-like domain-containing protein n=1 Tax=Candidatus Nitrobium versatile TaxID=2884831 RepID=A0A953LY20_9BACT|nr:retropepsin-like domain-containing protein [Candidatus Nitrobium versatile]